MGRIIEIPFCENLVEFLTERLMEQGKSDFSGIAVVFPHHRPAFYLRQMMAERLKSPFLPPHIFDMDGFMSYLAEKVLPGHRLATNLDRVCLLYQAVAILRFHPWSGRDFKQFLVWGLKLDQVMEELDLELVSDEKLKTIEVGNSWEQEVNQTASLLMNHLAELRRAYHRFLSQKRLTTRGKNYALAAKNIEDLGISPFKSVYLAGLFALSQTEKVVIRYLIKQPEVNIVRQNDGTAWTPFEEMDNWAEVEIRGQGARGRRQKAVPRISLYRAFNTHSEVVGLRDELIKAANYEKTAIVLPEPEPLIPLLSEVMTVLPTDYNITMGYPAVRTTVYALLDLLRRVQETRREDGYYLPDYLSLLMHPYIKNIDYGIGASLMRILVHSIEEWLLAQERMFMGLDELVSHQDIFERAIWMSRNEASIEELQAALSHIHHLFITSLEGIKTMSQLGEAFEEILTFLIKHSPTVKYPFSVESFHSFFCLLDKIKTSLIKDEVFDDQRDIFDLFGYLCKQEHIPFQGIPLKGLQILGMLETRALSFERVFLLSANEGVLPDIKAFDSLLPLPLREALGLPLHYHDEEIYRYHFQRLVFSSEEVDIFYRQNNQDSRSRFIERLVWGEEKRMGQLGVMEAKPLELNVSIHPSKVFEGRKSPQVLEVLSRINLSAKALNTYLNCPARFYFEIVLGLKEKERLQDEADTAKTGIILHDVMDKLYRPFVGKGILGEQEYNQLEGSLAGILEEVFSERFGQLRGERYLLREMARQRLLRYIRQERDTLCGRIRIIQIEQSLDCLLYLDDGHTVKLTGRLDRIDKQGEEDICLDYKTGKKLDFKMLDRILTGRDEMRREIRSLQLPFYALLYQRVSHTNYQRINAKIVSLRSLKELALFDEEADRKGFLEGIFLPTLKNLITEILDPQIPFVADGQTDQCRYCSFPVFCRRI